MVPIIHFIRRVLQVWDKSLSRFDKTSEPGVKVPPPERYDEIVAFLRSMDQESDGARSYLETHIHRVARTLTMVPTPRRTHRVLELGAYMQMTPALGAFHGYDEVRGAYYGPLGRVDEKSMSIGGKVVFRCKVDHFNAELDRFPYDERSFDCVLACEIIEHLLLDPMHMLLEIHRVLDDNGTLVLTTPNIASFTAVLRLLLSRQHPQLYSMYPNPANPDRATEIPHVREYTPHELEVTVRAAGFEIDYLFTEKITGYDADLWIKDFLAKNRYPTNLRGEQIYLVAHKVAGAPVNRYPSFLYEGC